MESQLFMNSFEISSLLLLVSSPSPRLHNLLQNKTKVRLNYQQVSLTSMTTSTLNQQRLYWEETFPFGGIEIGDQKKGEIEVELLSELQESIFSCRWKIDWKERQQSFRIQWSGSEVGISFYLEIQNGGINAIEEELDHSLLAKQFITSVKRRASNIEEENVVEVVKAQTPQVEVKEKQLEERKRRETNEELKLAEIFKKAKEKARSVAKDYLKKMESRVCKKIQSQKPAEIPHKNSSRMDRIFDQKNKENRWMVEQQLPKAKVLEERGEKTRNGQTVPNSENGARKEKILRLSLSKSLLKEEIGMYKSKFGDRIYDNQSASTMQKSVLCFSVPKGPRFRGVKYNGLEPSYYVNTCFSKKNKGPSFGFGNRKPYPDWLVRNMHENPAPNLYSVVIPPEDPLFSKGFSFGIPYSYYDKTSLVGAEPSKPISNRSQVLDNYLPKLGRTQSCTPKSFRLVDPHDHYHFKPKN